MLQTRTLDLQALLDVTGQPCVSMYLPTGAKEQNLDQGRIRLKNMLRAAHGQLKEMGARESNGIGRNLEKAERMADANDFWSHSGRGLAIFISDGVFERYPTPEELKEVVVVSERFHLKPLLPIVSNDIDFRLLKISRKNPRLYSCRRNGLTDVQVDKMPSSLDEALNEKDMQGFGSNSSAEEIEKEKYARYLRILDQVLFPILNQERRPLLLIGVPYERAIYKEINSYERLFDEGVNGNADDMTIDELHERALKAFAPHLTQKRDNAIERFHELKSRSKGSNDLRDIVAGAVQGRVDSLFAGRGIECWGRYDASSAKVDWHEKRQPGDIDLLDLAAISTQQNKGIVYLTDPSEVPGGTQNCPVAATYRY